MELTNLVLFLLIGLVAGWLASRLLKGRGFGLVGDLIVGVAGAFIGGWLFSLVGLRASGLLGELITAVVGAVALLYVIRLIKHM